jgi:uncharacterized cysteine cluster protein YcgN (CxxCxxCC family)
MSARFWEDTPLAQLDQAQWEALCDGCGKCCLHKLEDDETGVLFPTNVACQLLDRHTARCGDYRHRWAFVPDCIRLTPKKLKSIDWLPETCAYVRRAAGLPLPEWHYLRTGDRESVHTAGMSVRGWTISETDAGDLEQHLIEDDSPHASRFV